MKTRRLIVLAVMALMASIPFSQASAQYGYSLGVEIQQVNDFYEPLAPFGYWVQVPRYGWCWYPAYVDQGWRPYTNGHWLWSDDGWYWASEEPWAWATYHYGRWTWDPYYGWLWVPGTEWAPAWVGWRDGDGYVGWAPLPPECDFGPSANVIYVQQVVIAPQYFVFVERRHFCDLIRPKTCIINNQAIINKTANITQINRVNHVVVNQGPPVDMIQRYNPGRVVQAKIERRVPQEMKDARQQQRPGGQAPYPAPEVIRGSRGQADKAAVSQPIAVRPIETPVDPRADRAHPNNYSRVDRFGKPDTNVQNLTTQPKGNQSPVVVQQMPPPPSRQKATQPAPVAVQNQQNADSNSRPPQSERGNGEKVGHQNRGSQAQDQND
jgi:hypothetical protein